MTNLEKRVDRIEAAGTEDPDPSPWPEPAAPPSDGEIAGPGGIIAEDPDPCPSGCVEPAVPPNDGAIAGPGGIIAAADGAASS